MSTQQQKAVDPVAEQGAKGEATEGDTSRQGLLRKAYGAATQRLREAHREEFEEFYEQEAERLGVDYKRRPSAEERAAQKMNDLLAEFPHLKDRLTS